MRFIQHLLENTPSTKEKLLEVNSEDFLNVLLAAAGEEPLQENELEGLPEHMTVAELIDMYEGRMPPPRMNYSFDEVDPDVDAKSFSRAGAARRNAERSEGDYNREMGFRDAENERTRSGRFQGMDDEERMQHQMMHGTEEEEAKMQANRDRSKMVDTANIDAGNLLMRGKRGKRELQKVKRHVRRSYGANAEEEESNMPAIRDMVKSIENRPDEFDAKPTRHRTGQRAGRQLRTDGFLGNRRGAAKYPSDAR